MWANRFVVARACALSIPAIVLLSFGACQTNSGSESAGSDTLSLVDLELGPVTTYVEACERCHGPEGAFFSDVFQKQTREEIHEVNFEMLVGPGQLDPTDAEVDAMTDYMLSVRQKQPYIVITNGKAFADGQTDTLKGEMRPGTTLSAEDGGSTLETDRTTWSLKSPQLPLTLQAIWKDKKHAFAIPTP